MVEQKIVTDTQVVVKVEWCKKESNWTMANSDWSHLGEVILPPDNAIAAVFGSVDVCKDNFDLDVIPITSVPSVKVKSFEKNLDGSYFMFLPTLYQYLASPEIAEWEKAILKLAVENRFLIDDRANPPLWRIMYHLNPVSQIMFLKERIEQILAQYEDCVMFNPFSQTYTPKEPRRVRLKILLLEDQDLPKCIFDCTEFKKEEVVASIIREVLLSQVKHAEIKRKNRSIGFD